jgi:hypothetical protein
LQVPHLYKDFENTSPLSWQNRFTKLESPPIGNGLDSKTASIKPEELKQTLSKIDLRNITPNELAALGGYLFTHGEISGNTADNFVMATIAKDNTDPNAPIDAIKFFEDQYSMINDHINSGEKGLGDAINYMGDTLHNLYNIDNFINSTRNTLHIDVKA